MYYNLISVNSCYRNSPPFSPNSRLSPGPYFWKISEFLRYPRLGPYAYFNLGVYPNVGVSDGTYTIKSYLFMHIIEFIFCARMDYSNLSQYERYLGNICVHTCFAYVDDHINPFLNGISCRICSILWKLRQKFSKHYKMAELKYVLSQIEGALWLAYSFYDLHWIAEWVKLA